MIFKRRGNNPTYCGIFRRIHLIHVTVKLLIHKEDTSCIQPRVHWTMGDTTLQKI